MPSYIFALYALASGVSIAAVANDAIWLRGGSQKCDKITNVFLLVLVWQWLRLPSHNAMKLVTETIPANKVHTENTGERWRKKNILCE